VGKLSSESYLTEIKLALWDFALSPNKSV